jgi:hypothetical protein
MTSQKQSFPTLTPSPFLFESYPPHRASFVHVQAANMSLQIKQMILILPSAFFSRSTLIHQFHLVRAFRHSRREVIRSGHQTEKSKMMPCQQISDWRKRSRWCDSDWETRWGSGIETEQESQPAVLEGQLRCVPIFDFCAKILISLSVQQLTLDQITVLF